MARMTEDDRAAPKPWTNRAEISRIWLSAAPQAIEAEVNRATPTRKTFLRPMRSPSRPAKQERAGERDQIGVDHPGQRGLREVQVALDGRQRHVHDRLVEDVHQHREADDDQRDPAPAVVHEGSEGRGDGRLLGHGGFRFPIH